MKYSRFVLVTSTMVMILAILSALPVATSSAQASVTSAGIAVSPGIAEIIIKPGETKQYAFYIANNTTNTAPLTISVHRLRPIEKEIDSARTHTFDASSWITVNEPHHILMSEERRTLTATITAPKNAEPGGHYATIVLEVLSPDTTSSASASRIATQLGVLVFITVEGQAVSTLDAPRLQIGKLQLAPSVPISTAIDNRGNIHLSPHTKVVVRNLFNPTKTELPFSTRIILPNTTKELTTEWKHPPLIGVYAAQAVSTYGSSGKQVTGKHIYFIVVRGQLLLLIVTGLTGGIFILKTKRRWRRAAEAVVGKPTYINKKYRR